MTMPTPLCPHRMQIHDIRKETPDVWTLSLICPDFYPYLPGQHALVSINSSDTTLRAYTLSSTPGVSRFITLTVRRLPGGAGSQFLTQQVKRGDYIWLSDARGEFTWRPDAHARYLLLAAGCGVTPIMSLYRAIKLHQPDADVQVIYSVRTPQDVIFADEWHHYPVTLVASRASAPGFIAGHLSREMLASIPDIASRTVMACGPISYMDFVENAVRELGVTHFSKEAFYVPEVAETHREMLKFTKLNPAATFSAPVGTTLLAAMESNHIAITAACRAGVCGCCKTRVVSGKYRVTSTMTLSETDIAEGYVLACSCHPETALTLA